MLETIRRDKMSTSASPPAEDALTKALRQIAEKDAVIAKLQKENAEVWAWYNDRTKMWEELKARLAKVRPLGYHSIKFVTPRLHENNHRNQQALHIHATEFCKDGKLNVVGTKSNPLYPEAALEFALTKVNR